MFILVIGLTVLSYAVGWLIGAAWLVPVLNTAAAWPLMVRELGRRQVVRAVALMLVWAATMGAAATVLAARGWSRGPEGDLFLRSAYREEMLAWVRTGVGPESDPAAFVPRHLINAGGFVAASLATGGALSMPMGAVLMNSMGEYVGAMAAESAHPFASAVLGWHPWAVLRVIGFVILGVVLSGPVLSRVFGFPFALRDRRRWVLVGVGLLGLDVALKWILAPAWSPLLRGLAGW